MNGLIANWIDVNNKLPEDDTYVLAFVPYIGVQRFLSNRLILNGATHWMPLPDPPNGENRCG